MKYSSLAIFHTILFHRCVGKVCFNNKYCKNSNSIHFQYNTKGPDSYSVGTLGYTDVDCDYIDFTYVIKNIFMKINFVTLMIQLAATSQELQRTIADKINQFHDKLRLSESNGSGQVKKKRQRKIF